MKFKLPKLFRSHTIYDLENKKDLKRLWKKTFSITEGMSAINAFERIGNEAIPFLIDILNKPNKFYDHGFNNHRNAQRILDNIGYDAEQSFSKITTDNKQVKDWINHKRILSATEKAIEEIEQMHSFSNEFLSKLDYTNYGVVDAYAKKARKLDDPRAIALLLKSLKHNKHREFEILMHLSSLGDEGSKEKLKRKFGKKSKISLDLHSNNWQFVREGRIHPILRKEINNHPLFNKDILKISERAFIINTKEGYRIEDKLGFSFLITEGSEVYMEEADKYFYKVRIKQI